MEAIFGSVIQFMMGLAFMFMLAAVITVSVTIIIRTVTGKPLSGEVDASKEEGKSRREPGRAKPAFKSAPKEDAVAARVEPTLSDSARDFTVASDVDEDERIDVSVPRQEASAMEERLAAEFDAETVHAGPAVQATPA
jgi:hypothetical protein